MTHASTPFRTLTALGASIVLLAQSLAFAEAPGRRILAGDDSTRRLAIIAADGSVEWEIPVTAIHDAAVLPNGNVLLQQGWTRVQEVTPTRQVVWEYDAAKANPGASHFVRISENTGQRLEIDTSRLRTTQDPMPVPRRSAKVKASPSEDRLALIRAPRSETNKGRSPDSRRYIRGVLHSHPASIYTGAFVTLLVMLLTPLAVMSALLLLLSGEMPDRFGWVPGWLIVLPLVLPLVGICYLIWGLGGSCRVCGQGLFRHSAHLKNKRAHRIPGLGYVFPLCIQILLFHWFRCTHCGTPVRLKE